MTIARSHRALMLAALLLLSNGLAAAASADDIALDATIQGAAIQKVGFRATIQKLAIQYNLAGVTTNNDDGSVAVHLQGDGKRIERTLDMLRAGNGKSSSGNSVSQSPAATDSSLKTFTILGWTSLSRNITTPYDLVFKLRPGNEEISHKAAKKVWNDIALSTLKGEDLAKFQRHLEDKDD